MMIDGEGKIEGGEERSRVECSKAEKLAAS
jgi:hypothetical protein